MAESTLSVGTRAIACEAAAAAVQAAVAHAQALGIRINVAVTDPAGLLMAFLRMPGAPLHSIDIAIDKAFTSASFGFPTKAWMGAIGHDDGMKFGFSNQPRLIVFGGGLPIPAAAGAGKDWIGGIGVSGASEAEDEECARAGLAAIGLA